jgi:hypothetical protein
MERAMRKSKSMAVGFLLGTLLCGGALGFSLDRVLTRPACDANTDRQAVRAYMASKLQLTPLQRAQVDSLLDIRHRELSRIVALLVLLGVVVVVGLRAIDALVSLLFRLADVLLDLPFGLLSASLQVLAAIVDGIAEVAANLADGLLDIALDLVGHALVGHVVVLVHEAPRYGDTLASGCLIGEPLG